MFVHVWMFNLFDYLSRKVAIKFIRDYYYQFIYCYLKYEKYDQSLYAFDFDDSIYFKQRKGNFYVLIVLFITYSYTHTCTYTINYILSNLMYNRKHLHTHKVHRIKDMRIIKFMSISILFV